MPKYRGRVDCYINPTSDGSSGGARSRGSSELFTNIVQHLSSSGPDLGIEMLAANYGTNGSGWNFWNQADTIGHRAWACFRFHSASLGKFDMLVFVTTGSGVPHGSVNISDANWSYNNIYGQAAGIRNNLGFAFASHPSGSNVTQSDGPWNGTYSLTSASIGNPVWKVNPQGKGAFFPRANGFYGSFSGSRNNMFGFEPGSGTGGNVAPPWRQHVIISEDSFSLFLDNPAATNGFKAFHFGSFSPLPGMKHESPYFTYIPGRGDGVDQPGLRNFYPNPSGGTSWYGIPESSVEGNYWNEGLGAVSHPDLLYGTRALSYQTFNANSTIGYNNYINSGSWELLPAYIVINERSATMLLGPANHIEFVYGMPHGTLSNSSSSIAIGRGTASTTEIKYVFPWSGEPMLSGTVRTGRTFTYNT